MKRGSLSDRVGMFHRLVYPADSLRMTMLMAWSVQEWRSVAESGKSYEKREEQEGRGRVKTAMVPLRSSQARVNPMCCTHGNYNEV